MYDGRPALPAAGEGELAVGENGGEGIGANDRRCRAASGVAPKRIALDNVKDNQSSRARPGAPVVSGLSTSSTRSRGNGPAETIGVAHAKNARTPRHVGGLGIEGGALPFRTRRERVCALRCADLQ